MAQMKLPPLSDGVDEVWGKDGAPISLQTMSRVLQTLGVETATLDLGGAGKVALW